MTQEPADAADGPDPAARAARSERRRVARLHHPDLGGDPDAFVEAMQRLDRPAPTAVPSTPPLRVEVVRTTRGRVARLLRRRARPLVARLGPHRRYGGY